MYMSKLDAAFQPVFEAFIASPPITAMMTGALKKNEYRAMLRQVFHHTRENPQLQAMATAFFRGRQRDAVLAFLKHAGSEVGHDQLALNDFVTLGGDASTVPYENPLPATSALLAFGFHQIQNHNPVGYLGYLYFLEFTPTRAGEDMMSRLAASGVPESAMTFLRDHTEIDQGHNRLMHKYAEQLIVGEPDLDAVTYAMKVTANLYERMLSESIAAADVHPDMGWNWEELAADGLTPTDLQKKAAVA